MSAYDDYMSIAKRHAQTGNLRGALESLRSAQDIDDNDKVRRRIKKIQEAMEDESENETTDEEREEEDSKEGSRDDSGFQDLQNGLKIDQNLYNRLYPHQVEGVQFMWNNIHCRGVNGGMLSDDMGLGKTIQVSAFISALIDMGEAKRFIIMVPNSLVANWEKELGIWCPAINVFKYTGEFTKRQRTMQLQMAQRSTAVLLVTYGIVATSVEHLNLTGTGTRFMWDYAILDEAHNIKNLTTKRTKETHKLRSKKRLLLTGTPIMNNMTDFYALVKFFSHDTLLGNLPEFKRDFQQPIERARVKDAKPYDIKKGNELSKQLREITGRYILRRTKAHVNEQKADLNSTQAKMPEFGLKTDFVLWCKMTAKQLQIYHDFLRSDEVREVLMTKKSPLVQCTVLKKICDHPRRLSNRQCKNLGLPTPFDVDNSIHQNAADQCAANHIHLMDIETLLAESGKLRALDKLLDIINEKFLIFSSSIKILDMVAKLLETKDLNYLRMDGRDKQDKRDQNVKKFQKDESVRCFMLTTGVGAVGLTLTAATRVIVFDPSWNPSCDDQAVDRAYRIGQKNPVVVFRLITCDTIEEKIYRRQIFKKSVINQNNGENDDPIRHFDSDGIRQLFGEPLSPERSETQEMLAFLKEKRKTYPKLEELLKKLDDVSHAHAGIHDHDLVFNPDNEALVMEAIDQIRLNEELNKNNDRIRQNIQASQGIFQDMLASGVPIDEARRLRDGFRVNDLKDRGEPGPSGIRVNPQFLPPVPSVKSENGLRQQNIGQYLRPPGEDQQSQPGSKLSESAMKPKREGHDHWRVQNDRNRF